MFTEQLPVNKITYTYTKRFVPTYGSLNTEQ